jgi:hypothetical protein
MYYTIEDLNWDNIFIINNAFIIINISIVMNNYKYSQSWFINSEIHNKLFNFLDSSQENKILEIGCFEGLSSVFFVIANIFFSYCFTILRKFTTNSRYIIRNI